MPDGLSSQQARFLSLSQGSNVLPEPRSNNLLRLLFKELTGFFSILLILGSIVAWYLNENIQASVMLAVVVINIVMGVTQTSKANQALKSLQKNLRHMVVVKRDGRPQKILATQLVVGDIVILSAGDKIGADCKILEAVELSVDESMMTGESMAVSKNSDPLDLTNLALHEQKNMLFAGTTIVTGRGVAVVVSIGQSMQISKIAKILEKPDQRTILEKNLSLLGMILTGIAVSFAGLIVVVGLSRGEDINYLLTFAVALIVGAVPESLPTIITLALSLGVVMMSRNKAIVRRLPAVETLGSVTVIATDKTGTLTSNKLAVEYLGVVENNTIHIAKVGGSPTSISGEIIPESVTSLSNFKDLLLVSSLCSDAIWEPNTPPYAHGDPIETALLLTVAKSGTDPVKIKATWPRILEQPFSSEKKYMVTVNQSKNDYIVAVKGALDIILPFANLSDALANKITKQADELSSQGYKIIAFGVRKSKSKPSAKLAEISLLGFAALIDPVAEGVVKSIEETKLAGLRTIMITGDAHETARSIAMTVGIPSQSIIDGEKIDKMSKNDLDQAVLKTSIFARISPIHKLKIIESLQRKGQIVAVTGDGVNDAPALKNADIGIAMGLRGTEVAKEASDIVLLDDSFSTIVKAIGLGRGIYRNLESFIVFLLSGNFSELFIIAIAFTFAHPMPITAIQILWLNLVTDSFPALSLAFEKPQELLSATRPSPVGKKQLVKLVSRAIFLGLMATFSMLGIYMVAAGQQEKMNTLIFTFLVFFELIIVFSVRTNKPFWQRSKKSLPNVWLILAVIISLFIHMLVLYTPLSNILGVVPLSFSDLFMVSIFAGATYIIAEVTKQD